MQRKREALMRLRGHHSSPGEPGAKRVTRKQGLGRLLPRLRIQTERGLQGLLEMKDTHSP